VTIHADFGSGMVQHQTLGIPYQVVAGTQAKVSVTLGTFFDESDPGPEPIPANALIEGYPKPGNGDRHVLVLEKDGCWFVRAIQRHTEERKVERQLHRHLGHDN